jgi:hypothetical protein
VLQRTEESHQLAPGSRAALEPGSTIDGAMAQATNYRQAELAPWSVDPTAADDPFLRERVFAFLDQHGLDMGLDEADEPYLAWSVAGALGVSPDAVAPHVNSWRWAFDSGPIPARRDAA